VRQGRDRGGEGASLKASDLHELKRREHPRDYYKIDPEDIIVIYDDISLEPGQLRIRLKGSAGGHNGIKNIIAHLGTQEFPRIKVGVGAKPPKMDLADYVLSRFGAEEQKIMDEAFGEAAEAAVMMMTTGAERAMNHYNAKKKAE